MELRGIGKRLIEKIGASLVPLWNVKAFSTANRFPQLFSRDLNGASFRTHPDGRRLLAIILKRVGLNRKFVLEIPLICWGESGFLEWRLMNVKIDGGFDLKIEFKRAIDYEHKL